MQIIKREDIPETIGKQCEPTKWFTMTQQRINEFAETTEDHQFIHVDTEAAKNTPFGGTIAHGFLSLSMLSAMAEEFGVFVEGALMGINYGFNKIRFLSPVPAGANIRGNATIADIVEKPNNQILITYDVTVEIEGNEKPALVAQWMCMFPMG